jgi:hypothetical protein
MHLRRYQNFHYMCADQEDLTMYAFLLSITHAAFQVSAPNTWPTKASMHPPSNRSSITFWWGLCGAVCGLHSGGLYGTPYGFTLLWLW